MFSSNHERKKKRIFAFQHIFFLLSSRPSQTQAISKTTNSLRNKKQLHEKPTNMFGSFTNKWINVRESTFLYFITAWSAIGESNQPIRDTKHLTQTTTRLIKYRTVEYLGSRRNNVGSVLVLEHWTRSRPSLESWRDHGNLPNQSTCVLWIWRRHLTVSLGVSCGGSSKSLGYWTRYYGLSSSCTNRVRVWSRMLVVSLTRFQ